MDLQEKAPFPFGETGLLPLGWWVAPASVPLLRRHILAREARLLGDVSLMSRATLFQLVISNHGLNIASEKGVVKREKKINEKGD